MTTNRQYVIHQHRKADDIHLDLMLETDQLLETFRIYHSPDQLIGRDIQLEKIFDHPRRFLSYQGPVNKGKGSVRIVDKGTYSRDGDTIVFAGQYLNGRYRLMPQKEDIFVLKPLD